MVQETRIGLFGAAAFSNLFFGWGSGVFRVFQFFGWASSNHFRSFEVRFAPPLSSPAQGVPRLLQLEAQHT